MLTIKQIKEGGKIGEKFCGGQFSIKTYKKTWEVNGGWVSQVILMDKTGEIPADVNVGKKYNPLRGRVGKIKLIVAEIQEAEYLGKGRKKLYVDQWENAEPPMTYDEYDQQKSEIYQSDSEQVIRSKIKCWLVAARVESEDSTEMIYEFTKDPLLAKIIDEIMKG